MNSLIEFLDLAKDFLGSDYQTSKVAGVERQTVSGWRSGKSFPTNNQILKICMNTGINFVDAIRGVEMTRNADTDNWNMWVDYHQLTLPGFGPSIYKRQTGNANVTLLASVAGVSFGMMSLTAVTQNGWELVTAGLAAIPLCILC